ncbi:MAG: alpha-amylase, partial [Muribaculaceae bacterium]|nr:alpha-amylase [Muribaculaceae bacterium]
SGTAIEQLQLYVPEFIDLLKKLADTKCVEFLSGTYSHSLASLEDPEEFLREVKMHDDIIKREFGQKPKVFANTELIYDDDTSLLIRSMGFSVCLTEGAKHILGWKSPNYVYSSAVAPELKLLLTNNKLSNDITRNFNNPDWEEYPLTADKYVDWIASLPEEQQIVNLYLPMDAFGSFIPASTGIFDFLKALPKFGKERGVEFTTPSAAAKRLKPVDALNIPFPISDINEAADVAAWKGNDLQREALGKLYAVGERVNLCTDRRLKLDWEYLQSSDHFYYMATGKNAAGSFSPYDSPFSAFTNYMNVLADFIVRVEEQYPEEIGNEELNSLLLTIRNQASEIDSLNKEVKQLKQNILTSDDSTNAPVKVQEAPLPDSHMLPADAKEEKKTRKSASKKSSSAKAPKEKAPKEKEVPKKPGRKSTK